jgi:photosystem II stability/assembly factor-like uncharacterized protein
LSHDRDSFLLIKVELIRAKLRNNNYICKKISIMKKTILRIAILLLLNFQLLTLNGFSQWQQCSLYGGSIASLAISGTNIFAGTFGGGVFLSTDYGSNWTPVNNGLPNNIQVMSLAVSGTDIYAGTNGYIYKTSNNGVSWDSSGAGIPFTLGQSVWSIIVKDTNIFAAIPDGYLGVFLSTDNGNTWNAVNNGFDSLTTIFCLAANDSAIFAGTDHGIYKSTNNGANWFSVNNGLPSGVNIDAIVIKDTIIFAGIYGHGVYKSTDDGANWTSVNTGLNLNVSKLAICGTRIYAGTGNGFYQTINNGQNWSMLNSGLTNKNIKAFAVNGLDVFTGTLGGGVFFFAQNAQGWVPVNNGITCFTINTFTNIGSNLFAGDNTAGVFLTADNGNTWATKNNGFNTLGNKKLRNLGTTLFASNYSGFYKSTNNGNSWSSIQISGTSNSTPDAITSNDSVVYVGFYNYGVFKSTDAGTTWTSSNHGLSNLDVIALAINSRNDIFAGVFGDGVYMSSNNGLDWESINYGFNLSPVNCLAANDTNIIAGLSSYNPPVVTTNNNGVPWNIGSNSLQGLSVNCLKTIGTYVYAATSEGVYYSKNSGIDWFDMSQGLPPAISITSLGTDGTYIFAGVQGNGVWKRLLSDITGVKEIYNVNNDLIIYPNPSNGIFTVAQSTQINSVEVVNMLGETVYSSKGNAENKKEINLSGLPQGIYFIKVNNENQSQVKKIVIN